MPQVEDKLERMPMELKRLVQMYLPRSWRLVTLGITMAVPGILETAFQGSEVIIMEGASTRTQFVYNRLQQVYGENMMMVRAMNMATERRSSPMLHVEGSSPQDDPVEIGMSMPRDRFQRIVHSESDSENEEVRFHVAQRKQ